MHVVFGGSDIIVLETEYLWSTDFDHSLRSLLQVLWSGKWPTVRVRWWQTIVSPESSLSQALKDAATIVLLLGHKNYAVVDIIRGWHTFHNRRTIQMRVNLLDHTKG